MNDRARSQEYWQRLTNKGDYNIGNTRLKKVTRISAALKKCWTLALGEKLPFAHFEMLAKKIRRMHAAAEAVKFLALVHALAPS